MHLTPTITDSNLFANLALSFRAKKLEEIAVEQSKPVPSQIKLTRLTIEAGIYKPMIGGSPAQRGWAEEIRQNFTHHLCKSLPDDSEPLRGGWDAFTQSTQASSAKWWIALFKADSITFGSDTNGSYISLSAEVFKLCLNLWF